ncbi:hypothetical protein RD792_015188 [Penstemon davidsonii]|uniref:FAD synthase n=1 Tax=Penstemon davidsonii TaxID=160366 RepID=A0ABR0CRZ0_9LAMI|nr:hypothetical protein RD792_015188 [Penstemon davidsonii]
MMLGGSRISQQLREYNPYQLGFYNFYNKHCYHNKLFKLSSSSFIHLSPLPRLPPPPRVSDLSFNYNTSSKRFFRLSTNTCSSFVTNNNDDLVGVSIPSNDNCVPNTPQTPSLSDCLRITNALSSSCCNRIHEMTQCVVYQYIFCFWLFVIIGGIVALGKFDALHIGHRELAIQAAEIGVPFLLSFIGMAEILGWEPRAPVVAKCDRKRVLSSWAPLCRNFIPKEFQVEFSKVRSLTPQQFVEKLSKELGVRGVVAGQNYRFGYRASGDSSDLLRLCTEYGMRAFIIKSVMDMKRDSRDIGSNNSNEQGQVSSTRVRHALANGDMKYVSELLGRPHRLILEVKKNEMVFRDRKRLSAAKSCLLNLPPRDGLYQNCFLFIGDEYVGPCRVLIDMRGIHLEFDNLAPRITESIELLGVDFGE